MTGAQLIAITFISNQNWTQLTYQFVPRQNFTQLYIFPLTTNQPVNNLQYVLQVDDIRSTPLLGTSLTISSTNGSTINWCNSTQLCVNGVSTSVTVAWNPSFGLNNTSGSCVFAQPCSATTYTVIFSGNACPGRCSNSISDTLSFTLNITPPALAATSHSPLFCGDTLWLSVTPILPYPAITYIWSGSQGFSSSQMEPIIPGSSGLSAGIYSLTIDYNGCTIVTSAGVQTNPPLIGDLIFCSAI